MNMLRDHTSSQRYTINFREVVIVYAFSYPAPIIHKTVYIRRKNADYDSNISFKRYNLRSILISS